MRTRRTPPAATLLCILVATACGGAARGAGQMPEPTATAQAAEIEAIFRARQDSARMRFTPADVRFMTGMIAHHAQALIMSGFAAENDASPAVQTLAARIINAQKDEIAAMQKWLRDRGQPVPEIHIEGTTLVIHGVDEHALHDHHDMPGMLTQEQLDELAAARGAVFDRLFLIYMIQHHQGAVIMVHDLFNSEGAGMDEEAFRLASDIQVDQTTEIARMEQMLASLSARQDMR